jgi:hypothetical protein
LFPALKVGLFLLYLATLVQGSRLRLVIISYINSPESNLGPINRLIWIDQINGVFLLLRYL